MTALTVTASTPTIAPTRVSRTCGDSNTLYAVCISSVGQLDREPMWYAFASADAI